MQLIRLIKLELHHSFSSRLSYLMPLAFVTCLMFTIKLSLSQSPLAHDDVFAFHLMMIINFLGMQIILLRVFALEKQDARYEVLRSLLIKPENMYLSKVCKSVAEGIPLVTLTLVETLVWNPKISLSFTIVLSLFLLLFFVILGLSALGVLLSGLSLGVDGRDILFSITYFPLTIPLLLANIKIQEAIFSLDVLTDLLPWISILIGFNLIYLTLGFMLSSEVLKP